MFRGQISSFKNFQIISKYFVITDWLKTNLKAESCCYCFCREAASNFLTALSLQRKSRSRQQCQQVMSGNIWAALRIALSMLDQPELFQAANIGDLDLLMRAFNLDFWEMSVSDGSIFPFTHSVIYTTASSPKRTDQSGADLSETTVHVSTDVTVDRCRRTSTLRAVLRTGTGGDCFVMDLHCNLWFPRRTQGRAKIVQVMP